MILFSQLQSLLAQSTSMTASDPDSSFIIVSGPCLIEDRCFLSPNFPASYGNSQSCIIAATGKFPLVLSAFGTEMSFSCELDFLVVGSMKYCGNTGPNGVTVTPNIPIAWVSDSSTISNGFKICSPSPGSCQPGHYGANPACTTCTSGRYSRGENAEFCSNCPSGKYSLIAAVLCTSCSVGMFSMPAASAICTSCPAGMYSAVEASICTQCSLGWFSSVVGQASCIICSTADVEKISCISACPKGTARNTLGQECITCPRGIFCPGDSGAYFCTAGKFAANLGSILCSLCDGGKYTAATGSLSCNSCMTGRFSNSIVGSTSCIPCSSGWYGAASEGSSFASCSICAPGMSSVDGAVACTSVCTAGQSSSASCSSCPTGMYSTFGASSCVTPVATFSVILGPCVAVGNCFTSPNYPASYGVNDACLIKAAGSFPLVVAAFNVESNAHCFKDFFDD